MEQYKNLHTKISVRSIITISVAIITLAFIVFYFAQENIKKEYEKRLQTPGLLITGKIVGYEIINDRELIKSLLGEDIMQCAIVGSDGRIYYSTNSSMVGKDVLDYKELNIFSKGGKKQGVFKRWLDNRQYFVHITNFYNERNEQLGFLYIKTKKGNFWKEIYKLILIYVIASSVFIMLLYYFIYRLINKNITMHLLNLVDSSKEINQGNLSHELQKIKSDDELEILEEHYKNFVQGLREKTKFATEIEKKNFTYEYTPLSEKDELGKALVELRNSLKSATEDEIIRKEKDEISNWVTNGIAKFSEILRNDNENIEQLGYSVISNMVDYLNANQGGFFLVEEDSHSGEKLIELKAAYAFNKKKHLEKTIAWGEGLVGNCILEGKTTYMSNIPDNYVKISSGLGESNPRSLLIVPLISNNIKYGALEIASFTELQEHHIDFVNRISEIIASTIYTVRNNVKTQFLLRETQEQSEKIRQAEEELRQNIEEMQATQEEIERTNKQLKENETVLKKQASELEKEKYLMDALMDNVPDFIYFKDMESKMIKNSMSHAKALNLNSPLEMVGKSDFDFFDKEHAQPAFDDEQKIIKTGVPIIDLVEKETHPDGSVSWVTTTKMPLKDHNGKIVGTFGISKDISKIKSLEEKAIEVSEKLEFENIMFSTLMDNIAARITYKDTEARHIRINKTKSDALGLKDQSEVFGKTDIEVFGDTHTRERLNKEIEQIRSGISSFNVEEKFKQKDGLIRWGDVNRIPLKNKKGDIIGGVVITWDITDKKNMQFRLEQANNLLKSFSENLPVVIFNTDDKGNVEETGGNGLSLLDLPDAKNASGKLLGLFPDIKKVFSAKNIKDAEEFTGKVKIKKSEYSYKSLLIKNKTTMGGFSGYILLEKN